MNMDTFDMLREKQITDRQYQNKILQRVCND